MCKTHKIALDMLTHCIQNDAYRYTFSYGFSPRIKQAAPAAPPNQILQNIMGKTINVSIRRYIA